MTTPLQWAGFYGFCATAALLWIPPLRRFWPAAALLVVALLLTTGALLPLGGLLLLLTALVWHGASKRRGGSWGTTLYVAGVLLFFALSAHLLPGFARYELIPPTRLSPDSTTYTRSFSADKAFAGLLFLALMGPTIASGREWRRVLGQTIPVAAATMVVVFGLALMVQRVGFSPKWGAQVGTFALSNLFLTCIPEEVFFRGILQHSLALRLQRVRHGAFLAILAGGLLFGLAHLGGGAPYALLAAVAGIGYGYAYHATGRIEAAILAHLALNLVHFLFFSYPFLA